MHLSAEIRWFWQETAPPGLEAWFRNSNRHPCAAGGGEHNPQSPRDDKYLRYNGQNELGLKLRGNSTSGVEVKGLVLATLGDLKTGPFRGSIELWCKWIAKRLILEAASTVIVRKWRSVRKFDTTGSSPVEIELNAEENSVRSGTPPSRGCIAEFTKVYVPASGQTWWTFGFEAFGTVATVETDLQAAAGVLATRQPPQLDGGLLASYPAWLGARIFPAL